MANVAKQLSEGPAYVLRVYSSLAVIALMIFGVLHVSVNSISPIGYLEVAGAIVIFLNMILLMIVRKVGLAKNIFLFIILLFLVLMVVTGGTENTGIFWLFTFPVITFFLTGNRQGAVWMTVFFTVMVTVWLFALGRVIVIPYNDVTVRQALIAVFIVSVGISAYEHSRQWLVDQTVATRKALRHEKMQAEVIVQYINEGIVATDSKGSITFMNQAAEKLLGWQSSDLLGKRLIDMVPMLDAGGNLVSQDSRPVHTAKADMPLATIATYRRKDGTTIPLSVTARPVMIDNKVVGGVGTYRDISEEQSTVHAKSEFVTLASHQLRTPISAIAWLSELLLNGDVGKLSAEQREHISSIHHSNQRMADLVSEMLIVSSLDLGTLTVTPQKIDITKVITEVVKDQKSALIGKKIHITEAYDPNLSRISCDAEMIKLILRHLLSNAIKYTPEGGQVTVQIEEKQHEKILTTSKGSMVITVTDSGYGIPSDAIDKVFTKFFRGKNILHADTDGTGLGLYIVKSVLDYVGGRVTFSSREEKGTAFTVLLPLEGMTKHEPSQSIGEKNV